jgi:hypothetical protein
MQPKGIMVTIRTRGEELLMECENKRSHLNDASACGFVPCRRRQKVTRLRVCSGRSFHNPEVPASAAEMKLRHGYGPRGSFGKDPYGPFSRW